jgi:GDP-mannose 6-dehydrogenase
MVGLAFKPGTDDMRESPYVIVAKRLIGEGVQVRIYDPSVHVERLIGSNKAAVEAALAHLRDLLVGSLDELDGVDLVLVNHATIDAGRVQGWLAKGSRVMDLAGIGGVDRKTAGYEGIAW